MDVNYGGSTGFGREYRRRLNGQWGIVDVADLDQRRAAPGGHRTADERRLAIRGGSAGGYTVLAALTQHPEVFTAGASYYGISDLEALMHGLAQVRGALPRHPGRPVSGDARGVHRGARRFTPSIGCRAR